MHCNASQTIQNTFPMFHNEFMKQSQCSKMYKNDLDMFFNALAMNWIDWKPFTKLAYTKIKNIQNYFQGSFIFGVTNIINSASIIKTISLSMNLLLMLNIYRHFAHSSPFGLFFKDFQVK